MTDSISAAKLAIYIILLQPALYCLFKHGKTGFIGWLYVQIFCVLRIATGGIGLNGSSSTGAIIVSSIGLSPLLLAASGILHEARRATNPRLNRRLDIILEIKFHGLVAAAMALIIVAVTGSHEKGSGSSNKTLITVASVLMALAWLLLVIWALWSLGKSQKSSPSKRIPSFHGGRVLLHAVFAALPLLALRLGYAIAYLQTKLSHPESGFLTSEAVEVCLGMVPEILVTIIFLFVGIKTRSLKHEIAKLDYSRPVDEGYEIRR
ncbi:hypothetical protein BKA59DRAFT_3077 [Fusarium tricinctum]|jgi:hypothetical protein|uniref:DUF7702 domain-containing protein n=1 Tax=Fusarium tricinctum TaxID=61284 RepID=A0A8K0SAQ6_9HYPO|nr:hypothetical protein BKA59DRAFT_3077 [Fusarium tricinctum]